MERLHFLSFQEMHLHPGLGSRLLLMADVARQPTTCFVLGHQVLIPDRGSGVCRGLNGDDGRLFSRGNPAITTGLEFNWSLDW